MSKKKIWGLVFVSLAGLALGLISTKHSLDILKFGVSGPSFCTLSEFVNCDVVQGSSYAFSFGVPNGWWGVLFYAWNLVMAISLFWVAEPLTVSAKGLVAAWISLVYSIYMAFISLVVLKAVCLTCAGIYLVNLLLLILWGWTAGTLLPSKTLFKKWAFAAGLAVILFGIGGVVMQQAVAGMRGVTAEDVAAVVGVHFRGSQYNVDIPKEAPVWGNPNAKVTVVEFSDFQCPFCREAAFRLRPDLYEFRDQVRFVYLHFPLDPGCNPNGGMHTQSCLAAKAAVCAQKKNDFWDFHDALFRRQKELGMPLVTELVKAKGWNEKEFQNCLDDPATLKSIQDDIAQGSKAYVSGTPTILINNRLVKYWRIPEVVRAIVQRELKNPS